MGREGNQVELSGGSVGKEGPPKVGKRPGRREPRSGLSEI